ncbi:MAG: hypothetical protein JO115_15920 [Pseudonocardiales bacterium]|nr:hypothetical protein [Pseudonocardiales bacterium]
MTLPALIGVLSRARLVVVNDTGPMHLTAALGTLTVGIYREAVVGGFGPLAEHHEACVADTPAAVSYSTVRTVVEQLLHDRVPVPRL